MSGIEEFLKRLETISELLVPDWRSNVAQNFPKFAPLLDLDKLLKMNARHNLQENYALQNLTNLNKNWLSSRNTNSTRIRRSKNTAKSVLFHPLLKKLVSHS